MPNRLIANLPAIKGELILHWTEMTRDANTEQVDGEMQVNLADFYKQYAQVVGEIIAIKSLDDLYDFLENWGMNDEPDLPYNFIKIVETYNK